MLVTQAPSPRVICPPRPSVSSHVCLPLLHRPGPVTIPSPGLLCKTSRVSELVPFNVHAPISKGAQGSGATLLFLGGRYSKKPTNSLPLLDLVSPQCIQSQTLSFTASWVLRFTEPVLGKATPVCLSSFESKCWLVKASLVTCSVPIKRQWGNSMYRQGTTSRIHAKPGEQSAACHELPVPAYA